MPAYCKAPHATTSLKVAGGSSLHGVYPPNEQTLAEYEAWKIAQKDVAVDE